MGDIKQPHRLEAGLHPLADLLPRQLPLFPQQETDVLLHRQRRQQSRVLEHQPHIGRVGLIQPQVGLRSLKQP